MSSHHRPCRFVAGPVTRGLLYATTLAMATAIAAAQAPAPAENAEQEDPVGLLSGNELFPDNSILKGVTLPTYDGNLQLTNTLTAEELTIVTKKQIEARNLKIDFYGPNRTPRGSMALKKSFYDAVSKLLTTKEPVSFVSDELNVDGSSLAFDTENNRGFVHGPVTAISKSKPKTAANAAPAGDKAVAKKAEAGAETSKVEPKEEVAVETPPAAPTPVEDSLKGLSYEEKIAKLQLSDDRLKEIKAAAASKAPQVEAARTKGEESLAANKDQAEGARISMNKFLTAAALTILSAEAAPETTGPVPRPVIEEPAEGTETTTITSDGGGFIDNAEGLIVFLKNVKVVNPEFTMTAQKELKVFRKKDPLLASGKTEAEQRAEWEKKVAEKQAERAAKKAAEGKDGAAAPDAEKEGEQADPAPTPAPGDGSAKPDKPDPTPEELKKMMDEKAKQKAGGLGGGDIERIIATGTVLIDYKPKVDEKGEKKDPVKAAAHLVVYDFKTQEILLQGGSPWIMIGNNQPMTVSGDDSYIAVTLKNGRPAYAVTKGGSLSAQFQLDDKKDKKEGDKDKAKPGDKPQGGAKPPAGAKPQNGQKPANNGAKPNNR